ncbi:MAG TPA: thermopsin family protease [Thermoplasmata archaeon]|nr:thermopsin family protease [Thermoplasmata archaeon]
MVLGSLGGLAQGTKGILPSTPGTASPATVVSSTHPGVRASPPPTYGTALARAATVFADENATLADGGNLSLFLPPNLHQAPPLAKTHGHVVPLYAAAPAPMGVAYYGLNNTTGTVQNTTMDTTSLQGFFTTNDSLGVQTEEFDFGSQTSYGAQLNSVLTNVTILGQNGFGPNVNAPSGCTGYFTGAQSNYCPNEFWLQNVINYNPATSSLSFENNIWNFSNPTGAWSTTNGITLHGGSNPRGGFYAVSGPSITIAYPFTVVLYLNTTVGSCTTGTPGAASCSGIASGPVNEVFFNYTVYNATGHVVCPTSERSHQVCGEYDDVFWNSISSSVNPGGVAFGSAQIQANGSSYDPLGLTNDWEMDWGIGTSSGATTVVAYADAQVGINYCPAAATNTTTGKCSAYAAPPAAFDYGGETGETNTGAVGYWVTQTGAGPNPSFLSAVGQPVARFVTGPSLLLGLWNASTSGPGAFALNYAKIQPANAWIGVAAGSYITNQSQFQVAPTFGWYSARTGSGGAAHATRLGANLYLPPGVYTFEVLLSGYDPVGSQTVNLSASSAQPVLKLHADKTTGVYTPMWAFSQTDLANLSTSGAGTSGSPYQLLHTAGTVGSPYGVSGSVSWLFSDLNDYLFTVWLGAYINATAAYATFNPAPSFTLVYPSWQVPSLNFFNVPTTDGLQYYLYHAQNVTIAHGANLYAWANGEATSVTSVVCNTCLNDLVVSNRFNVSDIGISFTGATGALAHNSLPGTRNVLWGNTFVAASPGTYAGLLAPTRFVTESDSFDRLYNNNFDANLTISETSTTNIDYWNVTCQAGYAPLTHSSYPAPTVCQPTSYSQAMNGFTLTGSIIGTSYQGGNFWYNYGGYANPYANLPYVGRTTSYSSGGIGQPSGGRAGDFAPLIPFTVYKVPFTETALGSSSSTTAFTVAVQNASHIGTRNSSATNAVPAGCSGTVCVNFYFPNGTYTFTASSSLAGYPAHPATGTFTVNGAALAVTNIVFGSTVTFTETGLPIGVTWYINVSGYPSLSTTTTGIGGTMLSIQLPNGSYTYTAQSADKRWASSYTPSFTVSGAALPVAVLYTLVTYTATFTETGLPPGTNWYVNISGQPSLNSTGTTITTQLPNGSYTYAIGSANRSWEAAPGAFTVNGGPVSEPVSFSLVIYAVTFTETGLPAGSLWFLNITGEPSLSSTSTTISTALPNGTYDFVIGSANTSWEAPPGAFVVNGASVSEPVLFTLVTYAVTFTETGLPAGSEWFVNITGEAPIGSTHSTITTELPNETYTFVIGSVDLHYEAAPGGFTVDGAAVSEPVSFSLVIYQVTFTETGLPAGTEWFVNITGQASLSSTTTTITTHLANATYFYVVGSADLRYEAAPGSFTVNGSSVGVAVPFSPSSYTVTFTETGLPAGTTWYVNISGQPTLVSTGTMVGVLLQNGSYTYTIGTADLHYEAAPGGFVVNGAPVPISVPFRETTYTVTFTEGGLDPAGQHGSTAGATWYVNITGGPSLVTDQLSVTVQLDNGSYTYTIGSADLHYAASPGGFTVNGGPVSVSVRFSLVTYTVTFSETGLPASALAHGWAVELGGTVHWTFGTSVAYPRANGSYAYLVVGPKGYRVTGIAPSGTILVSGASVTEAFTFAKLPTYALTFGEKGLVKGQSWCVEVGGWQSCTTKASLSYLNLSPGAYAYAVVSPLAGQTITAKIGTTTVGTSGTLTLTKATKVALTFLYEYAVTFSETGLASGSWSVTVQGTAESAPAGTSIVFHLANGSYAYKIGAIPGYTSTGSPKPVKVTGAPASVAVVFKAKAPVPLVTAPGPTGASAAGRGATPGVGAVALLGTLMLGLLGAAWTLAQRRREA